MLLACQDSTQTTAPDGADLRLSGTIDPLQGLVSWWPGDGHANDIVGANHGALQNDATFAPGMVKQAFSFDGTDDFVDIGDVADLEGLPQASVDLWMTTTNLTQSGATAGSVLLSKADGSTYPIQIFLCTGDGQAEIGVFFMVASGRGNRYTADLPISADIWTHVAAVFDNSQSKPDIVKLYVDGVLQSGTGTSTGCISTTSEDIETGEVMASNDGKFIIGARDDGADGIRNFFEGEIDEVEFFDRALSAAEIQAIYEAGKAGKRKPPVCVFHNGHTIRIAAAALQAHLGHGDEQVACPS